VLDGEIDGLTVVETAERILRSKPDLVGFSLMTPQLMAALEASARLKQARPDLPIVLGGAHIDSTKDDTFSFADCFDFAIHGEGEYPMLQVCQNLRQHGPNNLVRCLEGVGNVVYRDAAGRVIVNPVSAFIKNLDELPSVDYDLLDLSKYRIPTMPGKRVISMMLSRGCPFKCTFCEAPLVMGKKARYWSVPRVVADIKHYVEKYDCHDFSFRDSTFTVNKKWVEQFCDAVLQEGLKIKWRINTRANLVPRPLLERMAKACCYTINFGVESGHPQILKNIQKEVDLNDVAEAHMNTRELGIRTYSTILLGSPGETEETIRETIRFACAIRPSLAMFFVASAYPGTPMYDQAVKDGLVQTRWWATQEWDPRKNSAFQIRWGWAARGSLKIPGFDAEKWQQRATRTFYLRPRFLWDTLVFTLKNPHFLKHILSLSKELIPFYKIRLPWRKKAPDVAAVERLSRFSRCPSAPNWDYEKRKSIALPLVTVPAETAAAARSSA
jgi:magnesium-protoporphyrin IX monomethyl ester (oxidative) cyclase